MKKKVSKIDYSKAMLPRTRKAQFGDCFKMNYILILKCGLMLLLFFAPVIAYGFFMDFYYVSLMQHSTEEVEQTKMIFNYLLNGGILLFSLIAVIGITGVIQVLRNLIWGEGIYFGSDFAIGIRRNAGKNVLFAFIFSLFYALAYFVYSLFPETLISLFGLIIFALILLPIYLWIVLLNNTYDSKWTGLVRNGLFFYVKTIGWSILGVVMVLLPIGLVFIPFTLVWLKYILLVLFVVFVYPIVILIMVLYSTSKFDAYINKDNYSNYYLRGLNHD